MLDYPEAPSPMFTFQRAGFGVEAHVCGDDPYAKPWSGAWHQMVTEQEERQHDDAHGKTFDNWVFRPGVTSSPLPPYYSSTDREPGDQVTPGLKTQLSKVLPWASSCWRPVLLGHHLLPGARPRLRVRIVTADVCLHAEASSSGR